MEIICTKEEFARMIETCCDNRSGAGGCQGCMIGEIFTSDDTPCSEMFVRICKIAPDNGVANDG